MNWKATLQGLASAIGGGIITSLAQAYDKGNMTLPELKATAITGALLGLSLYFVKPATQQPPPPPPPKPLSDDPPPDPGPQG